MPEKITGRAIASGPGKRLFGLRFKMFFLFFFVPIVLMIAAGLVYMNGMKALSGLITKESSHLITKMAEEVIAEKGRSVAKEVEQYLSSHPGLNRESFMQDPALKIVGIQKVGQTGYTCLVSKVLETEPSCFWLHPKEELVGKDIVRAMRNTLGDGYDRWFKIQDVAFRTGKESEGYYTSFDRREKYMVMVPVAGTNFFVPSTTYIDEFTLPVVGLQTRANQLAARATRTVIAVLGGTTVLIALIVTIYSYRLLGRVKSLSDAANRISLGNIDVEIEQIKSKDEIEDLADAFSRMQASIRLGIRRLRDRE